MLVWVQTEVDWSLGFGLPAAAAGAALVAYGMGYFRGVYVDPRPAVLSSSSNAAVMARPSSSGGNSGGRGEEEEGARRRSRSSNNGNTSNLNRQASRASDGFPMSPLRDGYDEFEF